VEAMGDSGALTCRSAEQSSRFGDSPNLPRDPDTRLTCARNWPKITGAWCTPSERVDGAVLGIGVIFLYSPASECEFSFSDLGLGA
jgi:hypothetical protein